MTYAIACLLFSFFLAIIAIFIVRPTDPGQDHIELLLVALLFATVGTCIIWFHVSKRRKGQ